MAAGPGRRRAVLIGVQSHQHLPAIRLQGPRNDLHLMRDVLEQRCGFRADDIQVLFDEDATHDRVLGELAALARSAQATDVILIYFTGHSTSGSREEYLFVHDTRTPPDDPAAAASPWTAAELHDTITSRELHDALERITAASKLLILDTHPNDTFVNLARRSSSYAVLLASSPNESTYEYPFEQQGKPLQAGLLTYTLVQRLKDTGPHVTRAAFVAGLIEDVHTRRMDQTPYFLGNTGLPLLPHDRETSAGLLVELSLRRAYGALDRSWLAEIYDRAVTGLADVAFPDLHLSAGRAFLTLGDPVRAGDALERAHDQTRTPPPDLLAPLGITRIAAGRYDEALDVARRLAVAVGLPGMEDAVVPLVEQLRAQSGCALIVGIHDYQGPEQEIPSERETSSEAAADGNARRMAAFLVEHARFAPERVRVLLNLGARRRAILEAFEWLCKEAGGGPAVFYFAGNGSMQGNEGRPTLVSHDGRTDGVFDISLDELAQLARSSGANLVGLLDAGFRPGPRGRAVAGGRFVPRDLRPVPSTRDVRMRDDVVDRDDSEQDHAPLHGVMPVIGVATGFYSADTRTFSFVGAGAQRFQEALRARPAADDEPLWLANWLAASPAGDAGEFAAQFARNRVIEERMVAEFQRAERYPFEQAVVLLGNLIHKHDNEDPERLVSRGVAYGLLGDTSRARDDLDAARKLLKRADRPCFEAHYHHGRLLVESHREPERAVNELRHAVDEAPDHAGARYYLGEAILQMIKQQSQEEIKKHWDRYLELGAPLGHQAKITAFLRK
jgi:tetratricopeptide (TPR) repeat protein